MKIFLIPFLVTLAACASTPTKDSGAETKEAAKPPIGRVLTSLDLNLRTWNTTLLDEPTEKNLKLVAAAENTIRDAVLGRFDEIAKETDSSSKRNRLIAIASLGFCGEDRALPYLVRAMGDEDSDLAANALMSLGVLASPATPIEPILDLLTHSPSPQVRNQAAYFLMRICAKIPPTPELAPALRKSLFDSEPGVRAQAAAALGKLRDTESMDVLISLLADKKSLIASAAAFALGSIGNAKAREALIEAMESNSPRVREAAHRALVAIFGQDKGSRAWDWKSSP